MSSSIITTDKAKCRDCYRCVRVCPVKAIRIEDGQARVAAERCIYCGTCVRECPQQAKHVRDDLAELKEMLSGESKVVASVAPSFPAAFPELGDGLLQSALKKAGFDMVTETSVGAEMVAQKTAELLAEDDGNWVTSACPVVVNIVEMYFPESCKNITPIISPMVAHGKYLKAKYGEDIKVVFIGPCSAKKREAEKEGENAVDLVLTFEECEKLLEESGIDFGELEPTRFDDVRPQNAQLFPLEGGLAKTASMQADMLSTDFAALSGPDSVREMIDHLSSESTIRLFEALFCDGGCVNGPCVGHSDDLFSRKNNVLQYHAKKGYEAEDEVNIKETENISCDREIAKADMPLEQFSEEEIRSVLEKTGKHTSADELNCGACGYLSCRENAIAVLSGMAEIGMCIPWMRQLAERKLDQIIDNSPNGIIVVDGELKIKSFNRAFANMFQATESLVGQPINLLLDPEDYEKVAAKSVERIDGKAVSFSQYGLFATLSIYRLQDEDTLIGIYSNITRPKDSEENIMRIRAETLENAERVIEKQMRMAQEIASILGETTSDTRVLLRKLTELAMESGKQNKK